MMAAAAIAVGCSNDSTLDRVNADEIRFSSNMLATETRASYNADNFTQFNVTALGNGGTYFSNALVRKGANGWDTDRSYYWTTYQLTFYGYAPTALSSQVVLNPTEQAVNDFTPKDKVGEQMDIVAAYNTGTKDANAANGVDMKFTHQLAQIEVQASNEDATTFNIEVLGVKLGRIPTKSTLTFPTSVGGYGTWSTPTEKKSYGIKASTPKTLDGTMSNIMFGTDNWLMIPQQLTGMAMDANRQDNGGAYIAVLCRITDRTGNAVYPTSKAGETEQKYAYTAVAIPTKWEAGHKYTYKLKFFGAHGGAGSVDPNPTNPQDPTDPDVDTNPLPGKNPGDPIIDSPITFNVSIENWISGTAEDITIEN